MFVAFEDSGTSGQKIWVQRFWADGKIISLHRLGKRNSLLLNFIVLTFKNIVSKFVKFLKFMYLLQR